MPGEHSMYSITDSYISDILEIAKKKKKKMIRNDKHFAPKMIRSVSLKQTFLTYSSRWHY